MNKAKVLIFGAGRSSVYLIKCLQHYLQLQKEGLTIIAENFDALPNVLRQEANISCVISCINETIVNRYVALSDIVISMLPAHLHLEIAGACIKFQKSLVTASYVSNEIEKLHDAACSRNLVFLNEMGLDPGLDHMSAMSLINQIRANGGKIKSYASHTGGLVEKSKEENSWNYKFTWNPKNVIVAGSDGAQFLRDDTVRNIEYKKLFSSHSTISVHDKSYDSYANRNSLLYQEKYNLGEVSDIYRGTLRHEGYCDAWQVFVSMGMTDDIEILKFKKELSLRELFAFFLKIDKTEDLEIDFCEKFILSKGHHVFKKMNALRMFDSNAVDFLKEGTAAEILLSVLLNEWSLSPFDRDIVVMKHEVTFEKEGLTYLATSELEVVGESNYYTAMAKTVGQPMFEAVKLILNNEIKKVGVLTPTFESIYNPILLSLKEQGIVFKEKIEPLVSSISYKSHNKIK